MTTLTRWDPFREMEQEMGRLFARMPTLGRESAWLPPVDVEQTKDALVITMDLPGMTREDVSIELHDRTLTILGVRTRSQDEQHEGYFTRERTYGEFARSFTLPDGIKPEDIEATAANGELRILVHRPEKATPERITIAEGS
jgi:HSP20 family protein